MGQVGEEEIKDEEDIDEGDDTRDSEEESAPFGRKFLVFENSLLQLIQHCSTCLAPTVPQVQKVIGTMVVIRGQMQQWSPTHLAKSILSWYTAMGEHAVCGWNLIYRKQSCTSF